MELRAQNLKVAIGKKERVHQASILVKKKNFFGIIGANGCGKSTLLRSIYKSLKPKEGTIYLDKMDIVKTQEKKISQKLSVVSQFNELNFDLSVFQMVMLGRTPHKKLLESATKEDIDIVNEAIEKANLSQYAKRSFLTLSGGEKQRVVLARAIAQQPKFIVLDEPTNHLDISYQLEILNCVKGLEIGDLAALHDLQLAAEYCDYVYAMKDGYVVAGGTPNEVFTEQLVEELYDVKCRIYENPLTKKTGFIFNL